MQSRNRFLVESVLICALIAAATLAVYHQVDDYEFLRLDDAEYVSSNPHVLGGLSWPDVKWAFGSFHEGLWQPLVWLSYQAEMDLYGPEPGALHVTNVSLHVVDALLLFVLFAWLTGSPRRSGFVAAMFALHPLHVESVAWIAERKDVLSGLFWMLTMLAYAGYARRPSARRYLLVPALFALGLMAKQTIVVLPLALFLLDYWPLRRFPWQDGARAAPVGRLVLEKAPMLVMSLAAGLVSIVSQKQVGAFDASAFPLSERVPAAIVAYVVYLRRLFWPTGLAASYPYPHGTLPPWHVAAAAVLLLLVTWFVVSRARSRPYLVFGWLWYAETITPVIGFWQINRQYALDHFSYIPLTGMFVAVGWWIPDILCSFQSISRSLARAVLAIAAAASIAACGVASYVQAGYWQDDLKLFTHAVEVTQDNMFAHYNMASALQAQGRLPEAANEYAAAVRIEPSNKEALANLSAVLIELDMIDRAAKLLEMGVKMYPRSALMHNNLGIAYARQGYTSRAIRQFRRALTIAPGYESARRNLAAVGGAE